MKKIFLVIILIARSVNCEIEYYIKCPAGSGDEPIGIARSYSLKLSVRLYFQTGALISPITVITILLGKYACVYQRARPVYLLMHKQVLLLTPSKIFCFENKSRIREEGKVDCKQRNIREKETGIYQFRMGRRRRNRIGKK